MSQIQSLLESAGNGWKNMQSDAARLASKWEKTGLLEGFSKEIDKNNMSLILENQAKQLVVEQSSVGGGAGYGAFATGNGAEWAGIALPLVRKVQKLLLLLMVHFMVLKTLPTSVLLQVT
jgi:hypothetical protein